MIEHANGSGWLEFHSVVGKTSPIRRNCPGHLIVPVVYSNDGSTTLPSMIGLDMRKTAKVRAQMMKSDVSASCEPVPGHVSGSSSVYRLKGRTWAHTGSIEISLGCASNNQGRTHRLPNPNTMCLGSYSGSAPFRGRKRSGLNESGSGYRAGSRSMPLSKEVKE